MACSDAYRNHPCQQKTPGGWHPVRYEPQWRSPPTSTGFPIHHLETPWQLASPGPVRCCTAHCCRKKNQVWLPHPAQSGYHRCVPPRKWFSNGSPFRYPPGCNPSGKSVSRLRQTQNGRADSPVRTPCYLQSRWPRRLAMSWHLRLTWHRQTVLPSH